jgi:menaquinone-dependent protoporphyrinogen IX oxidase
MSKKAIVIYTSKRGSTKQYAEWIAGDLGCEAVAFADPRMKAINLYEYDCIIYGGWIRGSGIVDFDKFGKLLDAELMQKLIVFGVGMADETADNYAQVWGYSIGKLDPKNENRSILYILGGRYDPAAVQGMDKFLMKVMKTVLISGSTPDAKSRANFMKDRIENGVDLVFRDNIQSLVKDARKKLEEQ